MASSTAKPINLDKYKKADDGGRIVTAISVLGVPTYPKKTNPENGTHLVHWRVHLRWAGAHGALAKGSVVLDTYKDEATDPIIRVDVYSKSTLVSTAASNVWEFQTPVIKADLSVQTVVDLITAKGRQGYKYDGNGSGCLSWSTTLLGDYTAAGYVKTQATEDFKKFIEDTRKDEPTYWIPEDNGTYI
jgi:hypothetical protein